MPGHQSDTSQDLGGLWSKCMWNLLSVQKLYEKNKAINWCTYSLHGLWSCFVLLIRLEAEHSKDSSFAIGVEKFIGLHFTQMECLYIVSAFPTCIHHCPSKMSIYCWFDYLNTEKGLAGIHICELCTFTVVKKTISDGCQFLIRELSKKCIGHNVRCVICRDQAPLNFVRVGRNAEG